MGTSDKSHLSAKVPTELREQVEEYRDATDNETLSATVEELVNVGLRERTAPLGGRIRELTLDAAYHLVLVAVVTVIAGQMTTALTAGHAVQIAVIMIGVAGSGVAATECYRAATGHSDIGEALRGEQ